MSGSVLASPGMPCTLPNVSFSTTSIRSLCHLYHVTNTTCSRRRWPTTPCRTPRSSNLRRALTRPTSLDRREPRRKPRQRGRRAVAHLRTDPLPIARRLPRHACGADDCVSDSISQPLSCIADKLTPSPKQTPTPSQLLHTEPLSGRATKLLQHPKPSRRWQDWHSWRCG